jgi:condensation enzyme
MSRPKVRSFTVGQSKNVGKFADQYPLTSRQKDPDRIVRAPRNFIWLALRIKGELNPDALKSALDEVVARHEALRTRISYSETDGNLGFQEVLPPLPAPLTVHDIPVTSGQTRDQIAIDLLTKLNDELLPFTVTPSLRASLHRFDDHDAVLTLLTHHLYSDGWSADIILREIAACYKARVTGIPHTLPIPVPYREFAAWEQDFLQGEKAAPAHRFWMDRLAGAELCTLPADRIHGPDTLTPRTAVRNFSIDPRNFAKVVASAAESRCSTWHVFLAAFMALAEKVRGRSDITLLTVNNGRPSKMFYDTIGFFVNVVPVRLEFSSCKSFRDLLLLARKATADAQQNQIPFESILEMVPDLRKESDDQPALPLVFNYIRSPLAQHDTESTISFEQVILPEELPDSFFRGECIWTYLVVPPGEFRCRVEYEPNAVDASTIDRWGSDFISLILAIADGPDRSWKSR